MATTGNMKSVAEIIDIIEDKYTYIPLLQRNYKWTMECASELAEDLWDSYNNKKKTYQLNMITIYKNNEDNSLQILDGQQRLITLKLFLAFLERESVNINFAFERDFKINERKGRRYFIDYYLKKNDTFQNDMEMSVDIKRLYENFTSMIIPVSFRSIYMFYRECLDEAISLSKTAEELFVAELNGKIRTFFENIIAKDKFDKVKECIELDKTEMKSVCQLCQNFNGLFSEEKKDDEMSNDEIRISEYSNQYQEIWKQKIHKVIRKVGIDNIISADTKKDLASYIKNNVEMLYHETSSEPIDEFLNINENKTRFVISDYIRANMISDNPIDGNIDDKTKNSHQKNRTETLRLFSSLANYLYNTKYLTMWELIKKRYDDFEKHPDINRLKVLFCDKYAGTSTKGYSFETELKRLQYFEMMLKSLSNEIGLENQQKIIWSTYNAVYMLLECKEKYKFFNLFTQDDINNTTELKDVAVREKFCFFQWAYELAQYSEDFWDISYLLESQLYVEKCEIKKSKHLPKKPNKEENPNKEWCCINRGEENDELHKCIEQLIKSIKEQSDNE